MLLSQDEARFPLVPTLRATLGVKGHRPTVGTWDNKDLVYCFAALNVVTGQLTTHLREQPARSKAKTGQSQQQRLQVGFAAHLRDLARASPARGWLSSISRSLDCSIFWAPRPAARSSSCLCSRSIRLPRA